MFFGVAIKNVATSGDEQVLRITEGVWIVDIDVNDEEGFGVSKGENDSRALIMSEIPTLPPPVNSGKLGFVQREKNIARLSTTKNKPFKKKTKKTNSMLETQDTEAELSNVNM